MAGQQWFGVYRTAGARFELRRSMVSIEHIDNGCSQTKIVTGDSVPPLFLISGVAALRPGPIDTVFNGHRFLYPGESVSWQLRRDWFVLQAMGTATKVPYGTNYTGYELTLGSTRDRYATSQVLVHLGFGDNTPTILWAGDLDGDGSLDLLLKLPGGGYSNDIRLLLSSIARTPDHVAEAGRFYITDC